MYVYPRTYKGIFTYLREVPNKFSGKPIVEIEAFTFWQSKMKAA